MQLDDLLYRYFGVSALEGLTTGARAAGIEKMQVDLGMSRDRDERFALWSVLFSLEAAPDLDVAFADEGDRDAARNFMDLMARADGEPET